VSTYLSLFSYDKTIELIHDVKFEIGNKERIAIIGKNGRGKSTLLRLLLGELKLDSGQVTINQNVRLAYFGQTHIDRIDSSKTIDEELMTAFPSVSYAQVRSACGAMLFSGDDAKKVSRFFLEVKEAAFYSQKYY